MVRWAGERHRTPVGPAADRAEELEATAVELARAAGERARRGRERSFGVSAKSTATDLVTEVDREVEHWLVAELGTAAPRRRRPRRGG